MSLLLGAGIGSGLVIKVSVQFYITEEIPNDDQ